VVEKIADLVYHLKKRGKVYVCFDIGHSDFREGEQSYYKGHRRSDMLKKSLEEQEAHKKFNDTYKKLPELFRLFNVNTVAIDGVEADDLASLIVEAERKKSNTKITLITKDKDWYHMVVEYPNVRMFDGDSLHYRQDVQEEYDMSTRREFSILKSLVGDKSDNIKFVENMAEGKGTKLFNKIRDKYDLPSNDEVILETEKYVNSNPRFKIHKNHVQDGRTTVREAFESNMKIADPFTDFSHFNDNQIDEFTNSIAESKKEASVQDVFNKSIEILGYPVTLSEKAKQVYNVK